MIPKIICPTDFSDTANNAVEFAAHIARKTGAELLLRNVQSISSFELFPPKVWAEREMKLFSAKLEEMSKEINRIFKISCTYDIELTHPTLEEAITQKVKATDMIVMGTNGIDSWNQFFTGSNAYHVIQKAICPVLVIPENVLYKEIEKVVFAWDLSRESLLSFMKLKDFFSILQAEVFVVTVNEKLKGIHEDALQLFRDEWDKESPEVKLETIASGDITGSLKQYLRSAKADMLVMITHEEGVIYKLFHHSVTKELTEDAEYPLLVQHG